LDVSLAESLLIRILESSGVPTVGWRVRDMTFSVPQHTKKLIRIVCPWGSAPQPHHSNGAMFAVCRLRKQIFPHYMYRYSHINPVNLRIFLLR
jgi:hypothetical protein